MHTNLFSFRYEKYLFPGAWKNNITMQSQHPFHRQVIYVLEKYQQQNVFS